jgi:hypothetical protein
MQLICAAREMALNQEMRLTEARPDDDDDASGSGAPKTKIARLV